VDFLGIGPLEFALILVLALIIIGPREMVRAARTFGDFLRRLMMSDAWRAMQRARSELRTLPNRLARESGIREFERELSGETRPPKPVSRPAGDSGLAAWTQPAPPEEPPPASPGEGDRPG
jgi:Sec-independent protein translocase protein TatA